MNTVVETLMTGVYSSRHQREREHQGMRIISGIYTTCHWNIHQKRYTLFVDVYNMTGKEIDDDCLDKITEITKEYGKESIRMDVVMTILYMAMIAEERKENSILGKRIKRLGLHSLLFDDMTVRESANFMRGKKWRELDKMCRERGF